MPAMKMPAIVALRQNAWPAVSRVALQAYACWQAEHLAKATSPYNGLIVKLEVNALQVEATLQVSTINSVPQAQRIPAF